jgi:hypothetical protein
VEYLYSLYLRLYALKQAGAAESFAATVSGILGDVPITNVTRVVELSATAAIAVTECFHQIDGLDADEEVVFLDFYQFQQVWERYRNLAPRP